MNQKLFKILIILLCLALVFTLTFSVMGYVNPLVFWVFAVVAAVFAFIVLPRMNK